MRGPDTVGFQEDPTDDQFSLLGHRPNKNMWVVLTSKGAANAGTTSIFFTTLSPVKRSSRDVC